MAKCVCGGAMLQCSFGTVSSSLQVALKTVKATQDIANIMDHLPNVNIMPFGMCKSPSNPAVVAAKAPVPCVPVTAVPWVPGCQTVLVANLPVLNDTSKLLCNFAGVIQITNAGQVSVETP